jgi:hypothetical protein
MRWRAIGLAAPIALRRNGSGAREARRSGQSLTAQRGRDLGCLVRTPGTRAKREGIKPPAQHPKNGRICRDYRGNW